MLVRFDPFREMDRMAQQLFGAFDGTRVPMDAYRKGDEVVLVFDLPGVDRESIDLTVERGVLSLRAERPWDVGDEAEVYAAERGHGALERQVLLGEALDIDHVEASFDDGVLTVRIPVAEGARTRRIEVTTGHAQPAIEAAAA